MTRCGSGQFQLITPSVASDMLDRNNRNRPVSKPHVAFLANEMKTGRWETNGDAIRFDTDDNLLDGQHRLLAVIDSGVAIRQLVVTGISPSAFATIDGGARLRRGADVLAIACPGTPNVTTVAAALALIDKYMTGRMEQSVRYTNRDILNLHAKYPDVASSVVHSSALRRIMSASLSCALNYLFSQTNEPDAADFFAALADGSDLYPGNPILLLRERLIANKLGKAKLPTTYVAALTIKAWNAWRKGASMKTLKYTTGGQSPEAFPLIDNCYPGIRGQC